jgi:AmmeMemoRadiSam system protein B
MSAVTEVRPSPIAGTWYEGHAGRLASAVDGYIASAKLPELPGEVVAIIAPHAGHRYSGPVAGYAFAAIKDSSPAVVAVLSPMHNLYPYPFITSAHAAYGTPLGEIQINRALVDELDGRLKQRLGFGLTPVVNDPEHSLEIELPFLQRAVKPGFTLLPVMLRQQSREFARQMGEALAETLTGKNCLLVASTDLSHFHNQAAANALDAAMLAQVTAFSPEGIFDVDETGKGEACGLGALAAVLWAAKALGADTVKVLKHATSGDVTGDFQRVVGYGAAVVMRVTPSATP